LLSDCKGQYFKDIIKIKELVVKTLAERGKLDVPEVSSLIGVSEATVRRLFIWLKEEGLAIRVFGGFQSPCAENISYSFSASAVLQRDSRPLTSTQPG